jgi:uncharacterized protein (TIGR00251 family)
MHFDPSMSAGDFVEAVEGGCHLSIVAAPGAARTAIEGEDEWRRVLRIRVAAQAERGKANEELVRFLSEALSLSVGEVGVVRGSRSRRKVVFVPLAPETVIERLGMG